MFVRVGIHMAAALFQSQLRLMVTISICLIIIIYLYSLLVTAPTGPYSSVFIRGNLTNITNFGSIAEEQYKLAVIENIVSPISHYYHHHHYYHSYRYWII